jgi:Predicted transcriptional regulators
VAQKKASAESEKQVFAQRLRMLLGQAGFTLGDLATLIGVSPNSVSTWVTAKNKPIGGKVNDIAELFGVSNNSLLGKNKAPFEPATRIPSLPPSTKKRSRRRPNPRLRTDSDGPSGPTHAATN